MTNVLPSGGPARPRGTARERPRVAGAESAERLRIEIEGIVQGVGFRPFVHALATRLGLGGFVANDTRGVVIEIEGDGARLDACLERMAGGCPPLAVLEYVSTAEVPRRGDIEFRIVTSDVAGRRRAAVSADVATCDACLAELFDPSDRRHRYPFIN